MKKAISLFLCLFLAIAVLSTDISAATAPLNPGYIDDDNDVTIKDATIIQKYLADLCELTKEQEFCADVDNNGKITISDATMIQKYVADIITEFLREPGYIDVNLYTLYADYDSGMAMAGVPVTFTAMAKGHIKSFSYEFIIDDDVVCERSESNTFTYTFDKPGSYFIKLRVYNSLSVMSETITLYEVVEPYESDVPVITALYYDKHYFVGYPTQEMLSYDEDITITAKAIMGSGDYEYCFLINGEVVQDFSSDNQYLLKNVEDRTTYEITVYVRDSSTSGNYISKTITAEGVTLA